MKIWRIEHPSDGLGAFRSEWSPGPLHWKHHEYDQFVEEFEKLPNVPSPAEDARRSPFLMYGFNEWMKRHPYTQIKFGVQTQDQLRLWFTPALLLLLKKHGFKLRVYEAHEPDSVFPLTTQVAFCKDQCKLILDHDLTQEVLHDTV